MCSSSSAAHLEQASLFSALAPLLVSASGVGRPLLEVSLDQGKPRQHQVHPQFHLRRSWLSQLLHGHSGAAAVASFSSSSSSVPSASKLSPGALHLGPETFRLPCWSSSIHTCAIFRALRTPKQRRRSGRCELCRARARPRDRAPRPQPTAAPHELAGGPQGAEPVRAPRARRRALPRGPLRRRHVFQSRQGLLRQRILEETWP
mmetsp:Transcript_118253/g.329809  ORF Transcript_118253/g.329809 Transcript_118253/m.329809 type:complete len:204 (+) Transcript_118253:2501-3112(+)